MEKRISVVANELCSGCRNCEMWCSFCQGRKNEFNPSDSNIKILKDAEGLLNIPMVDCNGQGCLDHGKGEPLCVEMCPTGTLIYSDRRGLDQKRIELEEKRRLQPIFRLIAPWKYPYPWKPWPREGF